MSLKLRCPKCREPHELEARFAGKKVRCGECQHVFQVSEPEPGLKPIEDEPRKRAPPLSEEVDDVEVVDERPARKRLKPPVEEPVDEVEVVDTWGMKPKKRKRRGPGIGDAIAGGVASAGRIFFGVITVIVLGVVGLIALRFIVDPPWAGGERVQQMRKLVATAQERVQILKRIQDPASARENAGDLQANSERVQNLLHQFAPKPNEMISRQDANRLESLLRDCGRLGDQIAEENVRILRMPGAEGVKSLIRDFSKDLTEYVRRNGASPSPPTAIPRGSSGF